MTTKALGESLKRDQRDALRLLMLAATDPFRPPQDRAGLMALAAKYAPQKRREALEAVFEAVLDMPAGEALGFPAEEGEAG